MTLPKALTHHSVYLLMNVCFKYRVINSVEDSNRLQGDLDRLSEWANIRAEVIMLIILCIIPFRISCNSTALCSKFHALFSRYFSKSLSK